MEKIVRQTCPRIIECVPNFSEGKDFKKIKEIVDEVKKVKGVRVLGVDSDKDYNRTVVTFFGSPSAVKEAALKLILKAAEVLDMSSHVGCHPRIGAVDVCPFVPISGATMADCVALAAELGKEVALRLGIPVYLYGEAARIPERKNLDYIRQGEYEGLKDKLKKKEGRPDDGTALFNKKFGAIMIGARYPLIAYNVNLKTKNKKIADRIAGRIRESGWQAILGEGQRVRIPGIFREVKAMGVYLKEYGICQVSMNLTNYRTTPPHVVFETIKRMAAGLAEVSGSEIVGLIPREAILMTGRFYLPNEKSEEKLIRAAIKNLGLNSLKRFNPKKKIIEYLI